MNINQVPYCQSAKPMPQVKFGKATVFVKNMNQVHKDFWRHAMQDPLVLKDNALILSSLLLVLARVFAVNKSALQAKGTSEERHRKNEAVKTVLREVGGFTFSFIVLRYFQRVTKSMLRKAFGLPPEGGLIFSTKQHLKEAFSATRQGKMVKPDNSFLTPGYTAPSDPSKMIAAYKKWDLDRFFKKTPAFARQGSEQQIKQINNNMRTLMTRIPVLIGSIPAILLSGYFLERFTQEHANQVSEKINNWLNKNKKPASTSSEKVHNELFPDKITLSSSPNRNPFPSVSPKDMLDGAFFT